MRTKIVAGNWKMKTPSRRRCSNCAKGIRKPARGEVCACVNYHRVAPPSRTLSAGPPMALKVFGHRPRGTGPAHTEAPEGAYTGEIGRFDDRSALGLQNT